MILIYLVIGGIYAQQLELDAVIDRSARAVENVLPQGTKVAVLNFSSPSEAFSDYVIEELTGVLVTGRKITIVDRRNLALITNEMSLQLSGDVSDESAQAIGKMLGAQSIVSGTLTNMGNFHRFRIRVINVETAAIQTQVSLDLQNSAQVSFLLGSAPAAAGSGTRPAVSGQAPASASTNSTHKIGDKGPAGGLVFYSTESWTSSAPPPVTGTYDIGKSGPAGGVVFYPAAITTTVPKTPDRVYQIGDTGPAGGIIFYINPNAGDWKYLEAAPRDIGKMQWQSSATDVRGTKDSLGSGKENTELGIKQNVRPAMASQQYSFGGYNDWFMPSKAELDLMYINLKMIRDIGSFSDDWYWSSTQVETRYAWVQNFKDGEQLGDTWSHMASEKSKNNVVRPIRQF